MAFIHTMLGLQNICSEFAWKCTASIASTKRTEVSCFWGLKRRWLTVLFPTTFSAVSVALERQIEDFLILMKETSREGSLLKRWSAILSLLHSETRPHLPLLNKWVALAKESLEPQDSWHQPPLRCAPFMLTNLLLVQFPQHSPLAYLHRQLTLHLLFRLRLSLGALVTSLKALILGGMGTDTEPSQGGHRVGSRSVTSALGLSLSLRMPQSSLVYGQRWVNVPVPRRRLWTNQQHPKKDWTWTWWGFWTSSRPPWGRSSETVSKKWLASKIDFNNSDVIF